MAVYNPATVPSDVKALPEYLKTEQQRIAQAFSAPVPFIALQEVSTEPAKTFAGLTLLVSSTLAAAKPLVFTGGAGVYTYYGGSYKKLG